MKLEWIRLGWPLKYLVASIFREEKGQPQPEVEL